MRWGIHPSDELPGPSGSPARKHETVMIFLKQAPYKCLEHQIDLTDQVREKLQGSGLWAVDPTGQSLRRTLTVYVVRSLRRRAIPDRPFKVLVLCPARGTPSHTSSLSPGPISSDGSSGDPGR